MPRSRPPSSRLCWRILAKSLFRFDPVTGNLTAVMGQGERPSALLELDGEGTEEERGEEPGAREGEGQGENEGLTVAGELPSGEGFAPLTLEDYSRQVGSAALDPDTGATQLMRQLERLAQRALTAEQPALARNPAKSVAIASGANKDRRKLSIIFQRPTAGIPPPSCRFAPKIHGSNCQSPRAQR